MAPSSLVCDVGEAVLILLGVGCGNRDAAFSGFKNRTFVRCTGGLVGWLQ